MDTIIIILRQEPVVNPCPDHAAADVIAREIEDLAWEIFDDLEGASWEAAVKCALASFPDLMAYADAWDAEAGNEPR